MHEVMPFSRILYFSRQYIFLVDFSRHETVHNQISEHFILNSIKSYPPKPGSNSLKQLQFFDVMNTIYDFKNKLRIKAFAL
ncbi:unnamed protein product [Heterobilharzia americana]|nr:unnamed protein product [Heterobilharzia americana]